MDRPAFDKALADPKLLEEAARSKLDVQPVTGEEVQSVVAKMFAAPPDVVQRAKQALIYKGK